MDRSIRISPVRWFLLVYYGFVIHLVSICVWSMTSSCCHIHQIDFTFFLFFCTAKWTWQSCSASVTYNISLLFSCSLIYIDFLIYFADGSMMNQKGYFELLRINPCSILSAIILCGLSKARQFEGTSLSGNIFSCCYCLAYVKSLLL